MEEEELRTRVSLLVDGLRGDGHVLNIPGTPHIESSRVSASAPAGIGSE